MNDTPESPQLRRPSMWYQLSNWTRDPQDFGQMIELLNRGAIRWSVRRDLPPPTPSRRRDRQRGEFVLFREVNEAMVRRWYEPQHGRRPDTFDKLPFAWIAGERRGE